MNGKLTAVVGCMSSGKTAFILANIKAVRKFSDVIVFKPKSDTRSKDKIESRNGESCYAIEIDCWKDVEDILQTFKAEYVYFSECHFFGNDCMFTGGHEAFIMGIKSLLKSGVHVMCEGLDLSHTGNPFVATGNLLCLAEEIHKLKAVCKCGNYATRTIKLQKGSSEFEVGGDSEYQAVCADCFNENEVK